MVLTDEHLPEKPGNLHFDGIQLGEDAAGVDGEGEGHERGYSSSYQMEMLENIDPVSPFAGGGYSVGGRA
jgi:hypothetical protein